MADCLCAEVGFVGFNKVRKEKNMNCETGEIYSPETMKHFDELFNGRQKRNKDEVLPEKESLIEMVVEPTEKQLNRKPPKVGRNETCPCGSGKKFKHCHLILNFRLTDKRIIK